MNRVLSWPHTPIFPGLFDGIKSEKLTTTVTDKGTVRFELPLGTVEMKFSDATQQLPPGTEVIVWWKGGGFVCASADEVDREARESRLFAERLQQARDHLAAARHERHARPAVGVDVVLPSEVGSPLLLLD